MKIAFISAVLPYPLHSGGQVRIYNLLQRLSKKHDITLYAFIRNQSELRYISELNFCKKVIPMYRGRAWKLAYILRAITGPWPFLYATYENKNLQDSLVSEKDSYDIIHIEPGYVFPSLPQTDIPIVVGEHNIEHDVYDGFVHTFPFFPLRPFLRFDVQKMTRWEKIIWNTAAAVCAVSPEDARYIRIHSDQKNIHIVPNGADIEYFRYAPKKTLQKKSLQFLYVGNFAWIQNSDAIAHILRTIWGDIVKAYPGSIFTIIGKHFPDSLRELHTDSVSIIDTVPDIRTAYRQADILLAPIRIGGGTRYKIIEAMATGLPVVTSTLGASGLPVSHKDQLYIADSTQDVLHCIEHLLVDSNRKKLVKRARECIESSYSWEHIASTLDTCWRSV